MRKASAVGPLMDLIKVRVSRRMLQPDDVRRVHLGSWLWKPENASDMKSLERPLQADYVIRIKLSSSFQMKGHVGDESQKLHCFIIIYDQSGIIISSSKRSRKMLLLEVLLIGLS